MSSLVEVREWYMETRVKKTLESLKKNGFDALYVSDKDEAIDEILSITPENARVGLGGSVTLREMNLPQILLERGNMVADHWKAREEGASSMEVLEIRRKHINSDIFITSTNAITETGILVNIDGGGQRVSATIFGPGKVIVVTGVNKIVRDLDEAIWRAKNIAAPINAKRLNRKTPCTQTGICEDCESLERICNVTTIMHKKPSITPVTVILVGEKLGY
jgi:L-lactate utilization protein LutB